MKKNFVQIKKKRQNHESGNKQLGLTVSTFLALQHILHQKSNNPQTESPHPRKIQLTKSNFNNWLYVLVFLQCLHTISSLLTFLSFSLLRCFLLQHVIVGSPAFLLCLLCAVPPRLSGSLLSLFLLPVFLSLTLRAFSLYSSFNPDVSLYFHHRRGLLC